MAKIRYGKKPKKELTEKEIKHLENLEKSKKRKEAAKGAATKPPIDPEKLKKIWIFSICGCSLFIIIASVILINIYTVFTRKEKIDFYEEPLGFFQVMEELNTIYNKYNVISATLDESKLSTIDKYNYKALDYMYLQDEYILTEKNNAQSFTSYDKSYDSGEEVEVLINTMENITIPVLYETKENAYTITIAGETFESGHIDTVDDKFYTAEYNVSETNKIIICQDKGTISNKPKIYVYYYDGERAYYCGELETYVDQLAAPGDGYFTIFVDSDLMQIHPYKQRVRLSEENNYQIEYLEEDFYDYAYYTKVFARGNITGFSSTDANAETIEILETEIFELIGTDNREFVRFRKADWTIGYLKMANKTEVINNGQNVPAKDLMFGLTLQ